ncbi:MAG TPA: glycosyltransferase [Acidimicrobiales bacterium]|nr:glycosyltransferase [Acidimicrobiales bacterium]
MVQRLISLVNVAKFTVPNPHYMNQAQSHLRVLLVSPYGLARDGVARYSSDLVATMEGEGCDFQIVTPRRPQGAEAANVIGNLEGHSKHTRQLCNTVLHWSPDLVHVQFAVPSYGGRLLALLRLLDALPVRKVVTAHEVTRDIDRLGLLGRRVYRRLAESASCVMVHTQAAARIIESLAPTVEVHVIPHPVLPAPAEVVTEAEIRIRFGLVDRDVILMFGFVHRYKGLIDLVTAFGRAQQISSSGLDRATLVVAGAVRRRSGLFRILELPDQVHLARVRFQVRHRGLEDCTVFTGYVDDGEVAAWFQAAHAIVLPYRKIDQSGVLSLARAFGSSVIASDAGGFAEETGSLWTFPAGDCESLARLLARLENERPPKASFDRAAEMASFVEATSALYRSSPRRISR